MLTIAMGLKSQHSQRTIVSLTSTANRMTVLRYTLLSLIDQRHQPDRIDVNLSREPYLQDSGVRSLPEWLGELVDQANVQVRFTENIGPYRKLLPTLSGCGNDDVVVTCDDDVIYGEGWLKELVKAAESYPDAVVCGHARVPVRNFAGRLQSYVHWPVATSHTARALIPIGVGGVLYRRRLLDYGFLTWRAFLTVAPRQDDLWFKKASERKDTPVRLAPEAFAHVHRIQAGQALSDTNVATRFRYEWPGLFRPVFERAVYRIKAYAGIDVCENDRVWRAVEKASERYDSMEGKELPPG